MGGEPTSALAIVTIPPGPEAKVEDALTQLMAGAAVVLRDAESPLVGGHTSEGAELGLGFSVNGRVDPARVLRKAGLRPGDRLDPDEASWHWNALRGRHAASCKRALDCRRGAIDAAVQSTRPPAASSATARQPAPTSRGLVLQVTWWKCCGHRMSMPSSSLDAVPRARWRRADRRAGIFSSLQPQNVRLRRATRHGTRRARRHPRVRAAVRSADVRRSAGRRPGGGGGRLRGGAASGSAIAPARSSARIIGERTATGDRHRAPVSVGDAIPAPSWLPCQDHVGLLVALLDHRQHRSHDTRVERVVRGDAEPKQRRELRLVGAALVAAVTNVPLLVGDDAGQFLQSDRSRRTPLCDARTARNTGDDVTR